MKRYRLEHIIRTPTRIDIPTSDLNNSFFIVDDVRFEQGEYSIQTGPTGDFWVAYYETQTPDWKTAVEEFRLKLRKITAVISLTNQGYISFLLESFLILRPDDFPDVAIFRFSRDRGCTGLSLLKDHELALDRLLVDTAIPEEFYLYWNDATNSTGYSSKLLLMFAALESLNRSRDRNIFPGQRDLSRKILGVDFADEIFDTRTGLRNRLSHGEYWDVAKNNRDYVKEIHDKIILYFNTEILKQKLLDENVVDPQRNFYENREGFRPQFIKKRTGESFSVKRIVESFNSKGIGAEYPTVIDDVEFKNLLENF